MSSSSSEQHRMEEALRESEARFRALFDQANDAIFMVYNGVFVDCNAKGLQLYRRTRDQIIGHAPDEFAPPTQPDGRNSRAKASEIIQRALAGEAQFFEWTSCLPDGTPLHTEVSINRLELVGKVYLQAISRDVTERKQAERVLHESETRFRTLIDQSPVAICVSRNGTGIYANQKFLQSFGLKTLEESIGQHVSTYFAPEFQEESRERIRRRSLGLPVPKEFESVGLRADGSRFPMHVEVGEVSLADGMAEIGFVTDITERKRAEEQIAEQAALLDQARDAIVVRDLNGTILFWNKGAERLYGWTNEEALGRNVGPLVYPDVKTFEAVTRQFLDQGEWQGELQHLTKDRRELTIESRWTLVRGKDGNPKAVLAINTDITEKKKIEAQFMRAQRMESIGTLAGGIAHDLNNILTPIMMSIDFLKQTAIDSQAKRILETIAVSSQRGADIVRQVLSFARGLEGERVEVQPGELLDDIKNFVRETFPKNIRLKLLLPDNSWRILGDRTQLHQILLNLCVNARDAMPDGGNLSLIVENTVLDEPSSGIHLHAKAGRYVVMNVKDSGTGIPSAVLDKIFEPFFTTKEFGKGTGLGLSTVLAIVKSHGGFVNAESEPGQGTTFKIYLPAMEAASEVKKENVELASLPHGNGETVLIVDDEPSILAVTSQTLEAYGYRTLIANDGAEAVAIYQQYRDDISVILTDMAMPVMDGPTAIRAIRNINPTVKIIAASGSESSGSRAKEIRSESNCFLSKPYTARTLLKTLRTILEEEINTP
jgi:PAS domain S-box-containing protein